MTITKEIIDKSLSELKECYMYNIRLNGGEPFLAPDMIDYLMNQIIKKKIALCSVYAFTNGTIKDERIAQSFNKIAEYINTLTQKDDNIKKIIDSRDIDRLMTKNVVIEFSTNGHPTTDRQINETRDWYIDHLDFDNVSCILQSREKAILRMTTKGVQFVRRQNTQLEGKALSNLKKLINKPVSLNEVSLNRNYYSFIDDFYVLPRDSGLYHYIDKSITISANGNVFPGCMMSYDRVDTEKMFNIMDCFNDFYKRIDAWCWEYPINHQAKNAIGYFETLEFCQKNKILIIEEDSITKQNYVVEWIGIYKEVAKILHTKYENLNHNEIDRLAIMQTTLMLITKEKPLESIDLFFSVTYGKHNSFCSIEEIKSFCTTMIKEITKRNGDLEYAEQDRLKIANMKREAIYKQ